jgi:hypothetical protein
LIDAANGNCRAAIGASDGLIRTCDLRVSQSLGATLVRSDNLPELRLLILDKGSRGALLIGYPRTEGFIERRLLSGGAVLN